MANLSKDYDRIISEIEQTISNEQEREIVKQKIADLSVMFFDLIDNMNIILEEKISKIEEKQNDIDIKIDDLKKSVDEIEEDIYEKGTGEYDFEIVCPYCNNEFVTDLSMMNEDKTEIRCPECSNVIELDWNEEDEEGCSGHCGGCHGCGDEYYEDEENDNEENNEDDM